MKKILLCIVCNLGYKRPTCSLYGIVVNYDYDPSEFEYYDCNDLKGILTLAPREDVFLLSKTLQDLFYELGLLAVVIETADD
jgi:hypothetical protein